MKDQLAPAVRMTVDDVAPVETAVPGMEVARLDRGWHRTDLALVGIDDIALVVGRFDFKVATEAGIGAKELRFGLQLEEGTGSWNGKAFDLDRLWVYRPGDEHSGAANPHRGGRGATWATFVLPLEAMADAGALDTVDQTGFQSVLNADTRLLRTTIGDVLTEARNQTLTVDRARGARRELCDATASLLRSTEEDTQGAPAAHKITQQCLAVADDLGPIPTTAELAAALDVSDRWIRSSFERVYGVSVSRFFRARALHAARRCLTAADPTSTSVTEIAMACGFWHLGRFAGYYHAHFGEHPRTTLHRAT